jgi:hypothetical protein
MPGIHPGDSASIHDIRVIPTAVPANILICPILHDTRFPVTWSCMEMYAKEWICRPLDPDDPDSMKYGMRNAIKEWWTGERDLIHIDHDMVFVWENLAQMSNCDSLFCCCPSDWDGVKIEVSLGFSKFSARLQQRLDLRFVFEEHDGCRECGGEWWGFEHHLMEWVALFQKHPCQHMQVLNDHPFTGLKGKPVLNIDLETAEGRAELATHLREKMGWTLDGEA